MRKYIITYDMPAESTYRDPLEDKIARLPGCRILRSVWLAESELSSKQIINRLTQTAPDASIFVSALSHWAANFSNECTQQFEE